jgi:hypothetical protein
MPQEQSMMLTPSKGDDEHGVLRICLKFQWSEDCIQYSPRHSLINQDEWYAYHSDLSSYVLDCTVYNLRFILKFKHTIAFCYVGILNKSVTPHKEFFDLWRNIL